MGRGTHRETKAKDRLTQPEMIFDDNAPTFGHCGDGLLCTRGEVEEAPCGCSCGLCAAMRGHLEHVAKGAPRQSSSVGIAASYGGYPPVHCDKSRDCKVRRARSGNGTAPTFGCSCSCGSCKSATQKYLAACCMEHCGSERCLMRLAPNFAGISYPGCPCGCAQCHAIAVEAGLRPDPRHASDFASSPPIVTMGNGEHVQASPGLPVLENEATTAEEEVGQTRPSTYEGRGYDMHGNPILAERGTTSAQGAKQAVEATIVTGPSSTPAPHPARADLPVRGAAEGRRATFVLEEEEEPSPTNEQIDALHGARVFVGMTRDVPVWSDDQARSLTSGNRTAFVLEEEEEPDADADAAAPLFTKEDRELGEPFAPTALVVSAAAAAAGAAPTHRLRVLAEEHTNSGLSDPPTTGSACSLMPSCLYWLREEVPRDEQETDESALMGIAGHSYLEAYALGTLTTAIADTLEEDVPTKKRDEWTAAIAHGRRWLDAHGLPGRFEAEVPVAYDPESAQGIDLRPVLAKLGIVDSRRPYSDPETWKRIREVAELGPLTIPATLDLISTTGGKVRVWDWCFGRTEKKAQLTIAALALASIYEVDPAHTIEGTALYVDHDGVEEVSTSYTEPMLQRASSMVLDYFAAVPASRPLPGLHCRAHHCPKRKACLVTQSASMAIVEPKRAATLALPPPFGMSDEITTDEYAEWLLPVHLLVGDWWEKRKEDLKRYADSRPNAGAGITTKRDAQGNPVKCWRGTNAGGPERFSRAHAEALLKTLGATPQQIRDCYIPGRPRRTFREMNAPKSGR